MRTVAIDVVSCGWKYVLACAAGARPFAMMVVVVSLACVMCACASTATATAGAGTAPIKTLLVTGQNNHNWQFTSRLHAETLQASGRFSVDITDEPAKTLADAAKLAGYQLVVLDYNGPRWGEAAEKNFAAAVQKGLGVLVIHASNNAFEGWPEYEKMVALCWRKETGHGKFHVFDVDATKERHPVTDGVAPIVQHPDELYHRLANPQKVEFTTLLDAYSDPETGGVGTREPMAIVLQFGKGRIFHTPLGHVWLGAQDQKASICDPQFKTLICRGGEWAATGAVTLPIAWADTRAHNTLTAQESAAGWKLLFDGTVATGLRGFKAKEMPVEGWKSENGTLHHVANGGGGDLVTRDEYADVEFSVEWKISPKGNSGIMYRVSEDQNTPWLTGPEMQILDDGGHPDKDNPKTRAGTMYGLYACAFDVSRPAGEWNTAMVRIRGSKVEHWLNGWKVVDADLAGDDLKKLIAGSKFKDFPKFAKNAKGRIALQDHGDDVWFRNIKVRELK